MKQSLVSFLAVSALASSSVVHAQVHRTWFDEDLFSGSAFALTTGGDPTLYVTHAADFQVRVVPLTHEGHRDIERVDLGFDSARYLMCGFDEAAGVGFVQTVAHTFFTYGPASVLGTFSDPIEGVTYSAATGELYAVEAASDTLHYASYDPANPAAPVWNSVSIDLSTIGATEDLRVSSGDAGGFANIYIHGDPRYKGVAIRAAAGGAISQLGLPPFGNSYAIHGDVEASQLTIDTSGVPGTIIEIFIEATGQVLGSAVAGPTGEVSVPVSTLTVGDVIGVRPSGSTVAQQTRVVFATRGVSESGPSGLTLGQFGGLAARLLEVGASDFRAQFEGSAPYANPSVPFAYRALFSFGRESDIMQDPANPGRYLLAGQTVSSIPVTLGQYGSLVAGHARLPIPDIPSLAGTRWAMQWYVLDGQQTIVSNVAILTVQP